MFPGDLDGEEIQKGEDIWEHIADSLCYTAETNSIVKELDSNKSFHGRSHG